MTRPVLVTLSVLSATCGSAGPLPPPVCEKPSFIYADTDGDGYAADGTAAEPYCPNAGPVLPVPSGYAIARGDCDDADRRAFPGQVLWQSTPRASGSWDFNCDGIETLEIPTGNAACRFLTSQCAATGLGTWAGAPPPCGVPAIRVLGCDAACQPVTETRTQRCR